MYLGAHIGIAGGLAQAPEEGRRIGCDAIQIFSKSPQMWKGPTIPAEAAGRFRENVRAQGLKATSVHHGYLINLASPKPPMLARSRAAFLDEIERAEQLGVDGLIFHPGAHLGSGPAQGVKVLIESLNEAIARTPGGTVRLLLENAAGQGTAMCASFRELAEVIDGVTDRHRVGVAIDTCHLFAAGIDFRTPEAYDAMIDRLDHELGVDRVRAFHLNDAKAPLGSHRDRHENIGVGEIRTDGFRSLINDPRWAGHPGYLETPLDENGYALYEKDLATLRSLLSGAAAPPSRARAPRTGRGPRTGGANA